MLYGFLKSKQYAVLVVLLILVELACAAFIFFDKSWKEEIPTDKTGYFDMIYEFLDDNWEIVKWVALGIVILEALLLLLAIIVRAANQPAEYDSDDEYIGGPRQQIRQPLINRPPVPATGVPVGTLDQRTNRSDAWSAPPPRSPTPSDLLPGVFSPRCSPPGTLQLRHLLVNKPSLLFTAPWPNMGIVSLAWSKAHKSLNPGLCPSTCTVLGPLPKYQRASLALSPVRRQHVLASHDSLSRNPSRGAPGSLEELTLWKVQVSLWRRSLQSWLELEAHYTVKPYGLDTSEFTYNPSDSNRYQQTAVQPAEEKSRCIIM
ncbi:tobamovirus multiplication 2A [Actinidia rufa]|uniref:Tobamovirus multiplication 2A n=1 Tax=Actinidia rufa TaxID=165716 RepID=A0A7J0GX61_9ERIC|nr:tobamovirus multiplication 2A [Actinidia rufa]